MAKLAIYKKKRRKRTVRFPRARLPESDEPKKCPPLPRDNKPTQTPKKKLPSPKSVLARPKTFSSKDGTSPQAPGKVSMPTQPAKDRHQAAQCHSPAHDWGERTPFGLAIPLPGLALLSKQKEKLVTPSLLKDTKHRGNKVAAGLTAPLSPKHKQPSCPLKDKAEVPGPTKVQAVAPCLPQDTPCLPQDTSLLDKAWDEANPPNVRIPKTEDPKREYTGSVETRTSSNTIGPPEFLDDEPGTPKDPPALVPPNRIPDEVRRMSSFGKKKSSDDLELVARLALKKMASQERIPLDKVNGGSRDQPAPPTKPLPERLSTVQANLNRRRKQKAKQKGSSGCAIL